jgi:TPR repeat protein
MALELFHEACDGGAAAGCFNLALALEKGLGGKKDKAGAKELRTKACEGGHQPAC